MKKSDTISSIKKIATFFPTLSNEELEILLQSSTELKVKREQNIFVAGEKAYSIYLLTTGCVKFTREFDKNKTLISLLAKEGDCFGIYEMFSKSPYFERTCTAITNCEYISVPNVAIAGIGEKNPSIYIEFIKKACFSAGKFIRRIEGVRYKSAKQRLANCFLDLYPFFTNRDSSRKVLLNRSDFADLADMTPETVSRIFSELKKIGAIEGTISDFTILDVNLLKEIADDKIE